MIKAREREVGSGGAASRAGGSGRPGGADRGARRVRARTEEGDDGFVTCVVSGERVPREEAVLVPLGPGQRVWMRACFTRDRDRPA